MRRLARYRLAEVQMVVHTQISVIYFIYRTTCRVTGKFYVGMHSTMNVTPSERSNALVVERCTQQA